jgi:hypothetical protein
MTLVVVTYSCIEAYDISVKLSQFLAQAQMKGGTAIPSELDPLPLIITRVGMNRYSVESKALIRVCLAVIASDKDWGMVESDLWALGSEARGLLNAFAVRRVSGEYQQSELDMLRRELTECKLLDA